MENHLFGSMDGASEQVRVWTLLLLEAATTGTPMLDDLGGLELADTVAPLPMTLFLIRSAAAGPAPLVPDPAPSADRSPTLGLQAARRAALGGQRSTVRSQEPRP